MVSDQEISVLFFFLLKYFWVNILWTARRKCVLDRNKKLLEILDSQRHTWKAKHEIKYSDFTHPDVQKSKENIHIPQSLLAKVAEHF